MSAAAVAVAAVRVGRLAGPTTRFMCCDLQVRRCSPCSCRAHSCILVTVSAKHKFEIAAYTSSYTCSTSLGHCTSTPCAAAPHLTIWHTPSLHQDRFRSTITHFTTITHVAGRLIKAANVSCRPTIPCLDHKTTELYGVCVCHPCSTSSPLELLATRTSTFARRAIAFAGHIHAGLCALDCTPGKPADSSSWYAIARHMACNIHIAVFTASTLLRDFPQTSCELAVVGLGLLLPRSAVHSGCCACFLLTRELSWDSACVAAITLWL
jgi:hypothetical protein